jgi:hypothetical protein
VPRTAAAKPRCWSKAGIPRDDRARTVDDRAAADGEQLAVRRPARPSVELAERRKLEPSCDTPFGREKLDFLAAVVPEVGGDHVARGRPGEHARKAPRQVALPTGAQVHRPDPCTPVIRVAAGEHVAGKRDALSAGRPSGARIVLGRQPRRGHRPELLSGGRFDADRIRRSPTAGDRDSPPVGRPARFPVSEAGEPARVRDVARRAEADRRGRTAGPQVDTEGKVWNSGRRRRQWPSDRRSSREGPDQEHDRRDSHDAIVDPRRAEAVSGLSASGEAWLPLLCERREAFPRVLAFEEATELVCLAPQVLDVVALEHVVERALRRREREWALRGK